MAHQVYKINDKKVPSVTTVIGRFKNSTGLLIWSNQLGLEGKRYQDELNKASEIGTSVHELAELHIRDHFYTIPEDEIVKNCFNKFISWWEDCDFKVNWSEKSFVSEQYQYGGTADLLVNDDTLIDFKTSKSIYPDYLVQGSAYAQMIKENEGKEISKFIVARFGKDESEDFEIMEFSQEDLSKAFEYFKVIREAFDLEKNVNSLMRKRSRK
jgi:hypothetical protein